MGHGHRLHVMKKRSSGVPPELRKNVSSPSQLRKKAGAEMGSARA
jgi:hypothetical protein